MAGKKSSFLTYQLREYLEVSQKERFKKYSEKQRNHYDAGIIEQASLAIDDLLLISKQCDEETLKNIFSKEVITELLDNLMDRIGMDEVNHDQLYYEIPVKAIEHRIREKYLEHKRFFKLEESEFPLLPSKPGYRDVKDYMRK